MKLSSLPPHLILLTAFFTCGCGPHLRRDVGIDKRFELSERCAQAPMTLKLQALGSSWGEGLVAQLNAPRAIHGRYELRVNGNRARSGRLITASNQNLTLSGRTKPRWRPDRKADNSHCLRPPEAVVVSGAARGALRVVETPPAYGPRPGRPGLPEPVERGEGLSAPANRPRGPAGATETPVGDGAGVRPGVAHVTVARWRTIPRDRGHRGRHRATFLVWNTPGSENGGDDLSGASIELRIWSNAPQDWRGATLVVRQHRKVPSVPEAEWRAHLSAKEAERRRARQARRKAQRGRILWCNDHPKDEGCWGAGGLAGARARQVAKRARRRFCVAHPQDVGCWGAGGRAGYVKRQREQRARWERIRLERLRRQQELAQKNQPPPAPLAEERPVKPSLHAEWIGGYWRLESRGWVWIGGWWRVPRRDLRSLGTTAPPPPPPSAAPVRTASPHCPHARCAKVLLGAWIWRGAKWVWRTKRSTPRKTARLRAVTPPTR